MWIARSIFQDGSLHQNESAYQEKGWDWSRNKSYEWSSWIGIKSSISLLKLKLFSMSFAGMTFKRAGAFTHHITNRYTCLTICIKRFHRMYTVVFWQPGKNAVIPVEIPTKFSRRLLTLLIKIFQVTYPSLSLVMCFSLCCFMLFVFGIRFVLFLTITSFVSSVLLSLNLSLILFPAPQVLRLRL